MAPFKHLLCSGIFGMGEYAISKDSKTLIACLISGVLVDIDHLIEYKLYCKEKIWDWEEFSSGEYFNKKKTVKVIFHSWEIAILAWIVLLFRQSDKEDGFGILKGFTLGYTLHLLLDSYGNNLNRWSYFLLYRYMKHWKQDELLDKELTT